MNTDYTQVGNIAGVNRLVIVSDDNFLSSPDNFGEWEDIVLSDDAMVVEILFAPNSCSLDVVQAVSANSNIYNLQIGLTKPLMTKELRQWIVNNAERKWIAFVEDYNFNTHVCGVPGAGLQMLITQKTGNNGSARNTNDIVLAGQMLLSPYIIENFNMVLSGKVIDLTRYATRDIKVMRGDSLKETFTFKNADGSLQILEDDEFFMDVRDSNNNLILEFYRRNASPTEKGFSLNEAGNTLNMQKTGTEMLIPAGTYNYDLVRITPDGKRETQLKGRFIVENNVTNHQN
ncbi:hypothetical protein [Emticicia sp. W12TSBA100-4]|uniref:hypothetical protein n=1 Tax=Emticicia sp. W12TSBA100-4 TaxID=3160965 RepID=UPI003305F5ED